MFILRQRLESLQSQRLAAHLRGEGVVAGVLNPITMMGGFDVRPVGAMLVLLHKGDRERAEALLREYELLPRSPAIDEDSDDLLADLSRLDASVTVKCPTCKAEIRVKDDPAECTSCAEPVDSVALIVDQLGPEALSPCYDDSATAAFEDGIGVPCPGCGYSLAGLARRGACPECAVAYDKDVILSQFFADLSKGMLLREQGD